MIWNIQSNNCQECCFNSTYARFGENNTVISDFDRFDQLKFNCHQNISFNIGFIMPNQPLILNNSPN